MTQLACCAQGHVELRTSFGALALLLIEQPEIATPVALLSAVADLAGEHQRPFVVDAGLL